MENIYVGLGSCYKPELQPDTDILNSGVTLNSHNFNSVLMPNTVTILIP